MSYEEGDKVTYHAIGGGNDGASRSETTGVITDVVTEPTAVGSQGTTVKASEDEPRYVIKNDNTGKETAYKEGNIVGEA